MNHIELLKKDLADGFSKSELETLIGLPQNVLSGIISGKRSLSKKSKLKIERFMTGEKPDPLNVKSSDGVKLKDLTTGNSNQVKPVVQPKTNYTVDTRPPMPEKRPGEHGVDYAARKTEWKLGLSNK